MRLDCGLMLVLVATLMTNCRSRPEASRTDTATDKAASINGRIAVFNIYDKATQLTRQAPGTMVSSRAALIPGLKSTETVSLADDKRKGEKYIPLNTAKDSVVFVGLEPRLAAAGANSDAKKADLNLLPETEKTLPPLSAQTLAPLEVERSLPDYMEVVLYNDIGWMRARGFTDKDGLLTIDTITTLAPKSYVPGGGIMETLYNDYIDQGERWVDLTPLLPEEAAHEFLKKGGTVIAGNYYGNYTSTGKYAKYVDEKTRKYWNAIRQSKEKNGTVDLKASTIDILAYIGEDPLYKKGKWENYPGLKQWEDTLWPVIKRKDLLPEVIDAAINGAAVKMKVPRDLEREILKYLDCDIK